LFLSFSFLSVKAVRYIGLFALVSAPILGGNLDLPLRQVKEKMVKKIPFAEKSFVPLISQGGLLLLMVCVFISTFRDEKAFKFGLGVRKSLYPDKAIEFIRKNQVSGNMYNSGEFGGYLAWKCYPERKIFFFNDPVLFEDLIDSIYQSPLRSEASKPSNFAGLFEKFNINYILKSYQTPALETYYIQRGDWELVYWDERTLVYLKDNETNRSLIEKYAYKHVDPLNFNPSFAQTLVRHNFARSAFAELERNLRDNPYNFKAHLFSGCLYESLNENEKAIKSYLQAKQINPQVGYIHYTLGMRLGKLYLGNKEIDLAINVLEKQKKYLANLELYFLLGTAYAQKPEAKAKIKGAKILQKALKLDSRNSSIRSNLAFIYYDLGHWQEAIKEFKSSLETNPSLANSYYGLGLAYEKLALREKAIESWEKYIQYSTNKEWIEEAKKHLAILKGHK